MKTLYFKIKDSSAIIILNSASCNFYYFQELLSSFKKFKFKYDKYGRKRPFKVRTVLTAFFKILNVFCLLKITANYKHIRDRDERAIVTAKLPYPYRC